jgi:hypothetical protein
MLRLLPILIGEVLARVGSLLFALGMSVSSTLSVCHVHVKTTGVRMRANENHPHPRTQNMDMRAFTHTHTHTHTQDTQSMYTGAEHAPHHAPAPGAPAWPGVINMPVLPAMHPPDHGVCVCMCVCLCIRAGVWVRLVNFHGLPPAHHHLLLLSLPPSLPPPLPPSPSRLLCSSASGMAWPRSSQSAQAATMMAMRGLRRLQVPPQNPNPETRNPKPPTSKVPTSKAPTRNLRPQGCLQREAAPLPTDKCSAPFTRWAHITHAHVHPCTARRSRLLCDSPFC